MTKKRLATVDLWRFIASIMIVLLHSPFIAPMQIISDLGRNGGIYVEFFFILSGCFTYIHFQKAEVKKSFESGVKYTAKKLVSFLPYTFITVTTAYLFEAFKSVIYSGSLRYFFTDFLSRLYDYILEIFALSTIYKNTTLLGSLWFLSAMLLVLPIAAYLCQIKSKYTVCFISILYPIFFYNCISDAVWLSFPFHLLRALAGLLSGVAVSSLIQILEEEFQIKTYKHRTTIFSFLEIFCLSFAFIVACTNWSSMNKFAYVLFSVGIGAMLSGYSITYNWHNKFVSYLGKLSLPIYLWHMIIGEVIVSMTPVLELNVYVRTFLYLGGTLIISMLTYWLVEKIRRHRKNIKIAES